MIKCPIRVPGIWFIDYWFFQINIYFIFIFATSAMTDHDHNHNSAAAAEGSIIDEEEEAEEGGGQQTVFCFFGAANLWMEIGMESMESMRRRAHKNCHKICWAK
jgi:hypothetical protein